MTRPPDPDAAARVVALAADGLSRAEIAVALGASLADFDAWSKSCASFAAALDDADTLTRAWWDRQPREALASGKPFRAAAWAKAMAQRYGRQANAARAPEKADDRRPVITARINIPDNGRTRRRWGRAED